MSDLLINPTTKNQVDLFIKSEGSGLALVAPMGAGKTFLATNIISRVIDNAEFNTLTLDSKSSGIEDVRELAKELVLVTPGTQRFRRAVIINDFDYLGHEAQNALLKIFEEPPSDTLIIITVNHEQRVLETIYSRLHKIVVKPITKNDIEKSYNKTQAGRVNSYYSLSMGYAGLFTSLITNDSHPVLEHINFAKIILQEPKPKQLAGVDKLTKSNDIEVSDFLDAIFRIFYASYQIVCMQNDRSRIKTAYDRLKLVSFTIDQINKGLGKKLALSKMFMKI